VSLHTTVLGDDAPGGTIAFCHGLFGQGKNWTQVAKALSTDHRVLLLDMPNHGRSPWTETFDYVELADAVADELRERSPQTPLALVGHSMGGKIAMCLALRHPELVERLVVVDVAPVAYPSGREFVGYIETMRGLDLSTLERRDQADEALRAAVPNPVVRSFLLQNLRRSDDGWHWQVNLDLLGASMDLLTGWPGEALGETSYDGPVLWVGGADSDYVDDAHAPEMDRRFPRNRRVLVKGAGHWVHSEQPAVFLAVPAGGGAVAARAVAGEVEHDVVAVVGRTPVESRHLVGPDHVDHRHRRLDHDTLLERAVGVDGVDVPVPVVVPLELGEGLRLRKHAVDDLGGRVALGQQQRPEGGPQAAYGVELALRRVDPTGVGPRGQERGQVLDRAERVARLVGGVDEGDRGLERGVRVIREKHVDTLHDAAIVS
jgi:pimeloyl-ACP methyl ester carboxylesterase